MVRSSIAAASAAACIAIAFSLVSLALAGGRRMRYIVPVSGVLLAGVALFGLIPELGSEIGWIPTAILALAGYGVLALLDRNGYAVCPSCSHGEKFAGSLVLATAVHAFVDGWGVTAARGQGRVTSAITFAILLHKAPEGMALGAMLRVSTQTAAAAAALSIAAELPTALGGAVSVWGTPPEWIQYVLAVVGGTFVFLGMHALKSPASGMRSASTRPGA